MILLRSSRLLNFRLPIQFLSLLPLQHRQYTSLLQNPLVPLPPLPPKPGQQVRLALAVGALPLSGCVSDTSLDRMLQICVASSILGLLRAKTTCRSSATTAARSPSTLQPCAPLPPTCRCSNVLCHSLVPLRCLFPSRSLARELAPSLFRIAENLRSRSLAMLVCRSRCLLESPSSTPSDGGTRADASRLQAFEQ